MSVGKRLTTGEPLTEHDVAERMNKAALRLLRIMMDARQLGLMVEVRGSRYMSANALGALRAEMDAWSIEPQPMPEGREPL